MKKKLLSLWLLLSLLVAWNIVFQFIPSVYASHSSNVALIIDGNIAGKPYWNGATPTNYTFIVENSATSADNITKVVIAWEAEGFRLEKFYYPPLWGAVYEPLLKQITFESTNFDTVNIKPGAKENFTLYFTRFPDAEGMYEFTVSTTDIKKEGDVNYVPSYIDKKKPLVKLVFPTEDAYVFPKGADVWINATAEDDLTSLYPSGINENRVFAVVENTKYPMKYDSINKVWYVKWSYGQGPITKDGWNYTYYVEAWDWANNSARDPPTDWKFFWYLKEGIKVRPEFGPVGTSVTITGVGFETLSSGNIRFYNHIFDLGTIGSFSTNKYGLFTATVTIPETPAKIYWFNASDAKGIWATAKFEVIPWITMSPSTGFVGTTVTIRGTGFVNSTKIELWYGGVANNRLDYTSTEYTTWNGTWTFWIRTVGGDKLVANPTTSPKGSFEATFTIPESWGGYHPVWVKWTEALAKYGSIQPNEQIFRVLPRISIDPSSGVSGQYVHLFGDGFSSWEFYKMWREGITVPEDFQLNPGTHVQYPNLIWDEGETGESYSREGTGIVLDFGPVQRYVDESHFILNGEAKLEWAMGLYYPMKVDALGTIIYYDSLHNVVGKIGSHFLQVPFLRPESYEVKAYRFNMFETGQPNHAYSTKEIATTRFTIETLVSVDLSEVINLLKDVNASITGVVQNAKGEIIVEIRNLGGNLTKIINSVNGTVTTIQGDVIEIKSNMARNDTVIYIKGKVDEILSIIPPPAPDVTLSLNIATVLSAIAAIAAIIAAAVVVKRLKVAA